MRRMMKVAVITVMLGGFPFAAIATQYESDTGWIDPPTRQVPEPATLLLLGGGLVGLAVYLRSR